MTAGRLLIILGIVLVVLGMLWPLVTRLGLGRLPGDIVIERETSGFTLACFRSHRSASGSSWSARAIVALGPGSRSLRFLGRDDNVRLGAVVATSAVIPGKRGPRRRL